MKRAATHLRAAGIYKHMKRTATHLRDKAKIALFSELSNFYLDLGQTPGQTPGQDRGAKTRPQGQLECANPQGSPGGMVRLGID